MKLTLTALTVGYDRKNILEDVSFELPSGITAVIGANGAGKTTLIHSICGFLSPRKGHVYMDGERFDRDNSAHRARFFYVPDLPPFPLEWTMATYYSFMASGYKLEPKASRELFADCAYELDLLECAGLTFAEMSRGQLYKAQLACVCMIDPQLWLFDELFSAGVDSHGIATIRRWITEAVKERSRSAIYTTQLPEMALAFSDNVLIVGGKGVTLYPTREFKADPSRLPKLLEGMRSSGRGAL